MPPRRKAVVVGSDTTEGVLANHGGFAPDSIVSRASCSRQELVELFLALVSDARCGDTLFFSCLSGLCFEGEVREIVEGLPAGVRLFMYCYGDLLDGRCLAYNMRIDPVDGTFITVTEPVECDADVVVLADTRLEAPDTFAQVVAGASMVTNRNLLVELHKNGNEPRLSVSNSALFDAPLSVLLPSAVGTVGSLEGLQLQDRDGRVKHVSTPGRYDRFALASIGILPNSLTALSLSPGFGVTLYEMPGFTGKQLDLRGYMFSTRRFENMRSIGFNTLCVSLVLYRLTA